MSLWIEYLRQERGWRVFRQRGEVVSTRSGLLHERASQKSGSCRSGARRDMGCVVLQADVAADGGEYAVCKSLNPVPPGFQGWDCAARLNWAHSSDGTVF